MSRSRIPEGEVAPSVAAPWRANSASIVLWRALAIQTSGIYAYSDDEKFFATGVGAEWFKHRYGTSLPGADSEIRGPHPVRYSTLFSRDPQPTIHDATRMNQSFAWAAGGVVSTTTDLNRFFAALFGGHVLPGAQLREMLTTVPTEGAGWIPGTRYGLGIFEQKLPCGTTGFSGI
ncbi:serine hydrolase [Nonomuraea sp. NPDC052265]|uniref:serine hydrolase n=1 Tax=Nonomuraea sp. NPDC052265 TaxID=3364374 RepID=UPI0037CAE5BF